VSSQPLLPIASDSSSFVAFCDEGTGTGQYDARHPGPRIALDMDGWLHGTPPRLEREAHLRTDYHHRAHPHADRAERFFAAVYLDPAALAGVAHAVAALAAIPVTVFNPRPPHMGPAVLESESRFLRGEGTRLARLEASKVASCRRSSD
jgi:hypothetical protein